MRRPANARHGRKRFHAVHRVADELFYRPAVPLDDLVHPLEVARTQRPQPLRIGLLAERRRSRHVAEQHRHRLADLVRGCGRREHPAAAVAEAGVLRVSRPQLAQISTR
jgi:hypothetical protein